MAANSIQDFLAANAQGQDGNILIEYFDEGIDADEAVRRLSAAGEQQKSAPTPARKPSRISGLMIQLAKEFPSEHDKLADLVKAVFANDDAPEGFGWGLRGHHDYLRSEISTGLPGKAPTGDVLAGWTNFEAFCAKLEQYPSTSLGIDFGLLSITQSLELKSPTSAQLRVYAPSAANWLTHASSNYLKACRQNCATGQIYHESSVSLWKGGDKYSLERWSLWKKRLGELREKAEIDDETRALVRKAEVALDKAERAKK